MRKIPATMATQHPDNACAAYFTGTRFLSAQNEIEECYRCFADLGVQEYMWDWEGKFVDEAVIDRLYNQHHDFFKKHQIGKDVFLTFRVPNIWIESSHKLPRAFMNMITAEKAAKTYEFYSPPLFEVILPMTTSSDQLIYMQKTFSKIAQASETIFDLKSELKRIDVIPLFEEFEVMANCKNILQGYVNFLKKEYKYKPDYMRIFTARSDTAMNGGLLPAKLAVKQALSAYYEFGAENNITIYPWIGGGCLPFRGGINPENIGPSIKEHAGMATMTVQSAFRYDYPADVVKAAIAKINKELPKNQANYERLTRKEHDAITSFNQLAAKDYRKTVEGIAKTINQISGLLPNHRERVQHVGLFGYSRGLGKVTLPRAIKFTGSLYSLGVPPELIGSGRALKLAKELGLGELVERLCPYLRADFDHAGHYLNRENLELLAKDNPEWKAIFTDIELIEELLNIQIGPEKPHHVLHRNFASNIYQKLKLGEDFAQDALMAAEIRKSLG